MFNYGSNVMNNITECHNTTRYIILLASWHNCLSNILRSSEKKTSIRLFYSYCNSQFEQMCVMTTMQKIKVISDITISSHINPH